MSVRTDPIFHHSWFRNTDSRRHIQPQEGGKHAQGRIHDYRAKIKGPPEKRSKIFFIKKKAWQQSAHENTISYNTGMFTHLLYICIIFILSEARQTNFITLFRNGQKLSDREGGYESAAALYTYTHMLTHREFPCSPTAPMSAHM